MGRKELARLDIGAEIKKEKTKKAGDKIPEMDNSDDKVCRGWILHLGHLLHRRGLSTMQREREKRQMSRNETSPRESLM